MFAFKKSNRSANPSVLSEKDIQDKLYGRYRPASVSGKSLGGTVAVEETELPAAPGMFATQKTAPKQTHDLFENKTQAAGDEPLGSVQDPETEKKLPKAVDLKVRFQASERQVLDSARESSKQAALRSPVKVPSIDWAAFFRSAFEKISKFFEGVAGVFSGLFSGIDFQNERLRSLISWTFGGIVLVALLFSVHLLNVKREKAMKESRSKPAVLQQRPRKLAPAKKAEEAAEVPAAVQSDAPAASVAAVAVQAERPLKPVTAQTAVPKTAAADNLEGDGKFVIQVATYVIQDDANRLRDDLLKIKIPAFVKGLSRSSGKIYYSVFLGRFSNYKRAQETLSTFKKSDLARSFKDAFIRTLK